MTLTLVTGGTGWLGRSLVAALVQGLPEVPRLARPDPSRRVRCLVSSEESAADLAEFEGRTEIIVGDLTDAESIREFCAGAEGATLFHCAGVIHPARRVSEFYRVNVEGTRTLLREAVAHGVRRAIVVSSNSPFGANPSADHTFVEESPFRPYLNYGRSKMHMEGVVGKFQARGELETVIVRAPWFYGPYQPARQTRLFSLIKNGRVPIVGDGSNRRSIVYMENLCQGLLLCEQHPDASGESYWIADARPYSMNEIIDTIEYLLEEEFGFRVAHRRVKLPALVGSIARAADASIQKLGFYNQSIHVLSEMNQTIACSTVKASRDLQYAPRVDLLEGMRRSVRWCLDQGIPI